MTNAEQPKNSEQVSSPSEEKRTTEVQSEELFRGQREIVLVHDGERYRLRITRRNKLILQK